MLIYIPYKNFIKQGSDDRVMIANVHAEGDTLQELLDSATVGLEDWNGNTLEHCFIDDLDEKDYTYISTEIQLQYLKLKKG